MKPLHESRDGECRFCERSADAVVNAGGAMVTPRRCNRRDCVLGFEHETRAELARKRVKRQGKRQVRRKARVLA